MDYTKHDYTALVTELTERFSEVEGWGQAYQTSTGQNLIRLFADATDSLLYMLERRSQESTLTTAILRRSVIAHASELGYRPRRTVSMTGEVEIRLLDTNGQEINAEYDVIIERFTTIRSIAPVIDFVTTEQAIIRAGTSSTTVSIKEGVHEQIIVDPTTDEFKQHYDYVITDYELIDEYSIEVDDVGTLYTDVETGDTVFGSLKYASPVDAVYDIKYGNDGMRIVFGDGVFGRAPQGQITIDYVLSSGTQLVFNSLGNQFRFLTSRIYDINQNIPRTEYQYEITNTSFIRGSTVAETVAEIAENAPESARANNRCVGNIDFEYWGRRSGIGGIVDINVYGEDDTGGLILTMNHVNIVYATSDGQALNNIQHQEFLDYYTKYRVGWVHPVIKKANEIIAVMNVYVRRDSRLPIPSTSFYEFIKTEIESYMALTTGSVGKDLQHSEIIKFVQTLNMEVNGVEYNAVDFVRIDITPMYQLTNPIELFDVRVILDQSYVPNTGDVWSLTIDGTQIDMAVIDGDTHDSIIARMRETIMQSVFVIATVETTQNGDVLRIMARYINASFTISVTGGDLFAYTTTSNVITIPSASLKIDGITDVVIAGTVEVVDSSMSVLYHDDGLGNLYEIVEGVNVNKAKIDYKYFEISGLSLPDPLETYYVRYNQNIYQNIDTNKESVVILSPFAETLTDTPLYSTISVI